MSTRTCSARIAFTAGVNVVLPDGTAVSTGMSLPVGGHDAPRFVLT